MSKFVSGIKTAIDHHPSLKWIDTAVRKSGLRELLHKVLDIREREKNQETAKAFRQFFDRHEEQFRAVSAMLEDDFSRRTLERVIAFRKTYDRSLLKDVFVEPQYFQKDIFGPVKDEVFVDGGAYVGDTVESFIRNFAGGYKKIYAWEPDEANLTALRKIADERDNIVCVPYGMWEKKAVLCFSADGALGSKFVEGEGENVTKVNVDSIDNVCAGDRVTFIKMDIEGSELAALNGAVNVIKRDKPRLAICIYHKPEDLYEIPFWIRQTVPEYKLYIRHHSDRIWETVVYATL